jgi:hypothetical protein
MKKLINLVAGPVAAALLCVASVSPSRAATTTFVSGGGSDANACTLSAPCRSIEHAIIVATNGANGGVVSCLDAGPYTEGFISANYSFTLDCRGVVYAAFSGGFAFSIQNSVVPLVTFRNVIFDGANGGGGAVQIQGGTVDFENCTFQNFTGSSPGEAVQFAPSVAGAQLTITDSVFANNGFAGSGGGIIIRPFAGVTAGAVIERTQVTGNTYGIAASGTGGGTALVEVRYITIADSVYDGIFAVTSGPTVSMVLEHSASVRNGGSGINAQGAGAYVSLRDSTVDWNATGLTASSGGLILSYQNNLIAGNLSPGVTPPSFSLQ